MDRPHSEMLEEDDAEGAERPKKKRREKAKSLEVELDSSGEFPRGYMVRSSLGNKKGSHLVDLGKFKQQ